MWWRGEDRRQRLEEEGESFGNPEGGESFGNPEGGGSFGAVVLPWSPAQGASPETTCSPLERWQVVCMLSFLEARWQADFESAARPPVKTNTRSIPNGMYPTSLRVPSHRTLASPAGPQITSMGRV